MIAITEKTLQDLEFNTVLQTISDRCNTEIGKQKALDIVPFKDKATLMNELCQTSEYLSSFTNNNAIPNHGFENLTQDLKFLAIEDSFLEVSSFRKIATLSETVNVLLLFLKKFHDYYPKLNEKAVQIEYTKYITQKIDEVVDKYGEIKDNASPDLINIRRDMNVVRGKVNQSFGQALSQYNSLGYLDEIKESIVENRRVLAVLAMYRRKVKGEFVAQKNARFYIYSVRRIDQNYYEIMNHEQGDTKRVIDFMYHTIQSIKAKK